MENTTPAKGPGKDDDLTISELLNLLATTEWLLEIIIRLTPRDDSDEHQGPDIEDVNRSR